MDEWSNELVEAAVRRDHDSPAFMWIFATLTLMVVSIIPMRSQKDGICVASVKGKSND